MFVVHENGSSYDVYSEELSDFDKRTGGTYEMTEHLLLSELYKENKVSDICADQTYPGYVYVLTNDGKLYYTKAD